MTLSDEARNFNWLLNSFVDQTAGVTDAVAVSSDGLLMAASSSLDRASAEQLAAIISGFVSLGHGASRCFDFAGLEQIIVAMRQGFLFVSSISDGSCLGVVATATATSAWWATRRRCSSNERAGPLAGAGRRA
jgi:predicted regulator of Ras-like GTPase activity (Roadblock/LC7/MglB family)